MKLLITLLLMVSCFSANSQVFQLENFPGTGRGTTGDGGQAVELGNGQYVDIPISIATAGRKIVRVRLFAPQDHFCVVLRVAGSNDAWYEPKGNAGWQTLEKEITFTTTQKTLRVLGACTPKIQVNWIEIVGNVPPVVTPPVVVPPVVVPPVTTPVDTAAIGRMIDSRINKFSSGLDSSELTEAFNKTGTFTIDTLYAPYNKSKTYQLKINGTSASGTQAYAVKYVVVKNMAGTYSIGRDYDLLPMDGISGVSWLLSKVGNYIMLRVSSTTSVTWTLEKN